MKYLLLTAVMVFLFPQISSAEVTNGNSAARSSVQTEIQGSGNVQTHIETTANGVTKTLDATGPGTYKVEVKSNGSSTSSKIIATPSATVTPQLPIPSNKTITVSETRNFNIVSAFKSMVLGFFDKVLSFFALSNA